MPAADITKKLSQIVDRLAPLTPQSASAAPVVLAGEQAIVTMDSVATLELILAIEEEFGITIEDAEIRPDHFDSVASLCRLVESKLNFHTRS